MCDPVSLVTAVGMAMMQQAQASDARQARNQAAQSKADDKKAAEDAAASAASSSISKNRRARQSLLSGATAETLGGGQAVKPMSKTLLGYQSAPNMYQAP